MARHSVEGVGTAGIVLDVKPQLLPHTIWSGGRNVRFQKNKCYRMNGVAPVYSVAKEDVLWVGFAFSNSTRYYLWSDGEKVYSFDGTITSDITRTSGGDYSSTKDFMWDLEMYNGLGILNNKTDNVQVWDPTLGSNKLIALANWNANFRCEAMRGFKNHLVALNVTKNGVLYPNMVKWSSPAVPGAVPSSWDHTSPTEDAGEAHLADTDSGPIVNGLVMGDYLYIYKKSAIHAMSYVGGSRIFNLVGVAKGVGLEVQRSLVNIPATEDGMRAQFFAGQDGFYLFDGSRPVPIFEQVFRNEILKRVENPHYNRSFSVINYREQELWYCVPEEGSELCTLAFVWNYVNNTYSLRDLGGTLSIASGLNFDAEGITTDIDQEFSDNTFFSDSSGFYDTLSSASRYTIVEACPDRDQLFYLDVGDLDYATEPWIGYVEREALAVLRGRGGAYYENYSVRKLTDTVIPKLYSGGCLIQVGSQEYEQDTVNWRDGLAANTGMHRVKLPVPVSGRFLSFRFSSMPYSSFELGGFDYELDTLGEY